MTTSRPFPWTGPCIQIYRGAVPGATHASRVAYLDARLSGLADVGVTAIAWHGFTTEMTASVFGEFANLAERHGMMSLAAFGLDASDAAGKGARMGRVAQHPKCRGVIVDAEGAYDNGASNAAVAMGKAFRGLAPDAWVGTQPWMLPQLHSHFPYREFAAWTDAVCPQFYCQDWRKQYGDKAYEEMWPRFETAWKKQEATVLAGEFARPRVLTVQMYKWPLDDAIAMLAANPTFIGWAEPVPDPIMMQALRDAHERRCVTPPRPAA